MTKDTDLLSEVITELAWDPSVQAENIGVAVRDGIVTLTGSVYTFSEKSAAEAAVGRIVGVRGIAEEMTVCLQEAHHRDDGDIAATIAAGLDWNAGVPKGVITSVVEDGAVILRGMVDWNCQRVAALRAVRHILGVRSVADEITVRTRESNPVELISTITRALKRLYLKNAAGITVKTDQGTVTLEGTVRTWAELDLAARAAWSASGVTDVKNKLAVVY